ncbi:uncharacterized protein LOC123016365 [Tribolium madens]|uniref:uncharacterized protein LOC123016365 n=1 Tax=Tribolium madens TaxID=41895 RepID=UPI001CF754D1|nr:uncharacterized protein LOC123016365 [Tribolium madens]
MLFQTTDSDIFVVLSDVDNMKRLLILFVVVFLLNYSHGIDNYMGTEIQKCLNCLCHARTGCFSRFNCASYSIDFDYWKTAGSPNVDEEDDEELDDQKIFAKCIKNENCILATLDKYAENIGHIDCNCDQKFDCKDRFAIHLYGAQCTNPKFTKAYVRRFNNCAKNLGVATMLEEEGFVGCEPPVF